MKRPPRSDQHRSPPPLGGQNLSLRRRQQDFTDEGSPLPGRVGKDTPRSDDLQDDEQAGDLLPRRR